MIMTGYFFVGSVHATGLPATNSPVVTPNATSDITAIIATTGHSIPVGSETVSGICFFHAPLRKLVFFSGFQYQIYLLILRFLMLVSTFCILINTLQNFNTIFQKEFQ